MEGRHEQLLVYNMVARGEVVLAEYSPFSTAAITAFSTLATHASTLIASSAHTMHHPNALLSFTSDNIHTYHFLVQDEFSCLVRTPASQEVGFVGLSHLMQGQGCRAAERRRKGAMGQSLGPKGFVVVSQDLIERKIAFKCLQRMKSDFYKCYMGANSDITASLPAHALDKEFGPKLKDHMEYCLDHFRTLQKLPSVRDQVQEVKESVLENIKKVHDSQITLEIDKLEVLQAQAENYVRQGKLLRDEMWIKQAKIKLVAIFSTLILVLLIWVGICHGIKC
ncbi:hypothetical protein L7F22_008664 [Adiantum nelumboides]|nr:hypothetical protein [Adiantum nelumboides]